MACIELSDPNENAVKERPWQRPVSPPLLCLAYGGLICVPQLCCILKFIHTCVPDVRELADV